jgi:WD repeat-containing protein 61
MSNAPKIGSKKANCHADGVWAVSWIGSEKIITGSLDGSLRLWNSRGLDKPLCSTTRQRVGLTSVAATRDGLNAVACYQDAMIRKFKIEESEDGGNAFVEEDPINPGMLEAYSICLSPGDDVVAAGTQAGKVNIWSMENNESVLTLDTKSKFVLSTKFSSNEDSPLLAASSVDGAVNVFDISQSTVIHKVSTHSLPVRSVSFSPNGRLVYSASDDRHVSVYDCNSNKIVANFSHAGMALSVDVSPDSRHFAVGSSDHAVTFWDLGMQKSISSYNTHSEQVWGVAFDQTNEEGKRFVSVGDDSVLQMYE